MKKLFSILVLSVMLMLPIGAKAGEFKPSCEKSCPTEDGKCTSTCTIRVENNTSSLSSINATLEVVGEGAKVTKVTEGEGWLNLTGSLDGNSIPLSFTATPPVTASSFLLATINLELESAAADCTLKLTNPETGVTVEQKITTTTTVKTGATLPIAIIACGAGVALVIYLTTKKNKKMYKI